MTLLIDDESLRGRSALTPVLQVQVQVLISVILILSVNTCSSTTKYYIKVTCIFIGSRPINSTINRATVVRYRVELRSINSSL